MALGAPEQQAKNRLAPTTRCTNWSNRAGGKAGPVAGIAGSVAGKDNSEGTADGGAGSLSLFIAVRILRGGEATRNSKAWLEGHFDRVDRLGGS